ncbi:MAG: hypothetical protein R2912_09425 [Eubacteriales bacterium]
MSTLNFVNVPDAVEFCKRMQFTYGVDISAQTYKPNCPPVALAKLPIIITGRWRWGLSRRWTAA